jgi:hypothetical protein
MVITGILLLASCGSSDSSSNSGTPISKAAFIEKANALCATTDAKLTDSQAALGAAATQEQVTIWLTDVLVPELGDLVNKIRDLGFPTADEALLGGLLDDAEKVIADIAKDPAAILALEESPFTAVNAGYQDYGLTVCAAE